MKQEDLENLFSGIADKKFKAYEMRIADLEAKGQQAEADKVAALQKIAVLEENEKAFLRADSYDVLLEAGRDAERKGVAGPNSIDIFEKMIGSGLAAMGAQPTALRVDKGLALKKAKELYPNCKALHGLMQKDLEASIPSAGGYGIPQVLSQDVIPFLYNISILEQTGATKVPMPNGNFRMVRMDTGATVGWIGEDTANDNTEQEFGDVNLQAKKLYAMVAVSNDLLRFNTVSMDSWVARDLAVKARTALDTAALYGTGTLYQPKGLYYDAIQTSGSTTTSFAAGTPVTMEALLEASNVPMISPAWVMNPLCVGKIKSTAFSTGPFVWANEINLNGTLNGAKLVSSASSLTYSTSTYADYWLGDWSEFIWGVAMDLSLEISREGTFVSGGTTYSAFQRDVTLVRLIAQHDFDVKHQASFVRGSYLIA